MPSQKGKRLARRKGGALSGESALVSSRGPPTGATSYRGPIVPKPLTNDQDMYVRRFVLLTPITTPGISTQLTYAFANVPSGYDEFSAVGALYQEYRVLAQRVRWIPLYINFVGSATYVAVGHGPLVFGLNRNAAAGVPISLTRALTNTDSVLGHTQTRMTKTVRAGTAQEMLFITTGGPAATWTTYLVSDAILTSGTTYGYVESELLIQFRNTV